MHPVATLTIGIPFYARSQPDDMKVAIDSILNQTYPPQCVHLVQDGLVPDAVAHLVADYVAADARIVHLLVERHMGVAYCLNYSILHCTTEYYGRMDADDYSAPTRLEKEVNYLEEHPDIDIVGTWAYEYDSQPDEQDLLLRKEPLTYAEIADTFHYRAPLIHASVVYRLTVFANIGLYNPNSRFDEDTYLWGCALTRKVGIANIPEPLYYIGIHGQMARRAHFRVVLEESYNKLRIPTSSPKLNMLKWASIAYRLLPAGLRTMIYKRVR